MNRRVLVIAVLCLGLAGAAAWSQFPYRPGQSNRAALESWQASLEKASASLKDGNWTRTKRIANDLIEDMTLQVQRGEGVGALVTRPLVLRALAEAGLGEMEAAEWDWYVAQAIYPDVTKLSLTLYGAAGTALRAIEPVAEAPVNAGGCETSEQPCPGLTPPKPLFTPKPRFPQAVALGCIPGQLVLGAVVKEDGRLSQPRLIESPEVAVLSLAAFEALRAWKFKPALLDGAPVKANYSLTIDFDAHCTNPFNQKKEGKAKQEKAEEPPGPA